MGRGGEGRGDTLVGTTSLTSGGSLVRGLDEVLKRLGSKSAWGGFSPGSLLLIPTLRGERGSEGKWKIL